MKLTAKQMKFAQAILAGKNLRQAALFAGSTESSAAQAGSRYMKNENVVAYINYQKQLSGAQEKNREAGKSPNDMDALAEQFDDPLAFLETVMNDTRQTMDMRFRAATAMLPYKHGKQKSTSVIPRQTKKQQVQEAAKEANGGIYGTASQVGGYLQ